MRTINKVIVDGKLIVYSEALGAGREMQIAPGSEDEAKLLQQIVDGEAEFGPDDDRTPVETFEDRMAASDVILPRYAEDLADSIVGNGGTIPDALATKVADKKSLRSAG
jgi:hypothetical protein